MKIISKFKDYYDFVAHLYGGGDPKIVYNRKRIGEYNQSDVFGHTRALEVKFNESVVLNMDCRVKGIGSAWQYDGFTWLVVNGRPFPMINMAGNHFARYSRDEKWEVFNLEKHGSLVEPVTSFMDIQSEKTQIGVEQPGLVTLSKAVGHPVFVIDGVYKHRGIVEINGECPILDSLGLAPVYPAEQLYQDLAYFLVNKMQDSPDLAPGSPITNQEKIVQHGFDLKQSFRHRK